MKATLGSIALALACVLASSVAHADEPTTYARVVVDSTILRSGPGTSYRRVLLAHRGDVFPIQERATTGYWFGVELPDGTTGWVLGAHVYNHEVDEEAATRGRFLPWLFAPPPLLEATGEVAIVGGVLGTSGFVAARPNILLDPHIGFGADVGVAVSSEGRLFYGAGSVTVNVFPRSPIVPYLVTAFGAAISSPNADNFVLEKGTLGYASAGGGLRFGFRYRLILRFEIRDTIFFSPNRYNERLEVAGGVSVFF